MKKKQIILGVIFVLAFGVMDFYPEKGSPHFRYNNVDPDREVMNYGTPGESRDSINIFYSLRDLRLQLPDNSNAAYADFRERPHIFQSRASARGISAPKTTARTIAAPASTSAFPASTPPLRVRGYIAAQ